MANADALYVREREVEAARSKLAADLAILSSPTTFAAFTDDLKTDAINLKDEAVARAKSSAQSTLQGLVEDIKARAAANPAAVLAIGAGIAWHLVRHPPITTALIGAGLYSLFKTTPSSRFPNGESFLSQARDRLREQVSDFASATKDQAEEFGESSRQQDGRTQLKYNRECLRGIANCRGQDHRGGIRNEQIVPSNGAKARKLQSEVGAGSQGRTERPGALHLWFALSDLQQSRSPSLQPAQPSRDTLLLGAAGVAVVAAMGFALQRRMSEADENR